MRDGIGRALSLVAALLLVTSTLGGAATTGMVDLDDDGPVGEANALACGGVCVLGGVALAHGIAIGAAGAAAFMSDSGVNESALAQADAQELHKNVYESSVTQHQNNQILLDSYGNFLQDTPEVATMEGKNAYIRALNNGTSEAAARAAAREAIADYYAQKQAQVAAQYETSVQNYITQKHAVQANANLSNVYMWNMDDGYASPDSNSTGSVTLVNGSTVEVTKFQASGMVSGDSISGTIDPTQNELGTGVYMVSLSVTPPNSNYNEELMMNFTDYKTTWSSIESQNAQIQDRLDTFINGTYSSYQKGEISNDDLIDPYLQAREYSPEGGEFDTWAISTLSASGLNPPENLTTTKTMVVRAPPTDGATYKGVLMSDGLPTGGTFQVNTTYNATTLAGPQYVVHTNTGETTELTGEFQLSQIRDVNGEPINQTTVRYREIDYTTTDLQEFKQLQDQVRNLTAELEARQSNLRDGGSTGGLFPNFGGGSIPMPAAVAIVAVLVGFVAIPVLYRP
ncbi:hypothetical protein [Halosimplex pelagicum]|uniref:Envelope protein N-terminal domain-containing protein n=1 Tax=Halosimplex pelagicum TaxID=869886 RepID=A0A7D5PFL7_9EURY|nr:hypothetical protein [Halosimplex pelagicum]QLH83420.1 hypothetical protein HZS54_18070 [Halosimplex pelagicum]